jgi:adenine-specific DNA-methyltransferase
MSDSSPFESIHKIERGDDVAQGRDLAAENLAKLAELFPGLLTESTTADGQTIPAIDADALRDLVGATVETESREKFGLSWHGKAAARRLALTPSTGTLRPCPGDDESVDWDTTKNVMIEGDNLEVLKLLQKSYAGRVKVAIIDPPYNTGNDFVYRDNFRDPLGQYEKYTGQRGDDGEALVDTKNREGGGRFHTDWLNMIYPRLLLARELLREDGLIFITIDDNEISNLRAVMDDVFGGENFIAHVIWQKKYAPKSDAKYFSESHDFVLVYARQKKKASIVRLPRTSKQNDRYKNPDDDPRGPWKPDNVLRNEARDYAIFPVRLPSGDEVMPPSGTSWRYTKEKFDALIADNRIWFGKDGTARPAYKRFLSEVSDSIPAETIWPYKESGHNDEASKEVRQLFDNNSPFSSPKPVRLIQRILSVSTTDADDIVLDFFAGSGTTGHAVMAQNVVDGGNRRYVLVQLPELVENEDFDNIAEMTKERLRRAGKKLRDENPIWVEQGADTGFRVFKLDTANVKAWEAPTTDTLEPGEINTLLEKSVDGVKLDRSEEDLLWGAMLNLGLPLDGTIEQHDINGMTVYAAGACTLLACFAKSIDRKSGEALAGGLADLIKQSGVEGDVTVLLRDSAFDGDDAVKVNLVENLRQHAPDPDKVRVLSI